MLVSPLFESFNSGELSPWLQGRTGLESFRSGLETCENLIALLEGPAERRPGTRFIASTRSNAAARLVPFKFSVDQAYVLEFSPGYVRFYRNQGQIYEETVIYELHSPEMVWNTFAAVKSLSFAQTADVLYIFSLGFAPRKLSRLGHTDWSITKVEFQDGPYNDVNITETTLTPSTTTGYALITASSVNGINNNQGFKADDVGRHIRISNPVSGVDWGWAVIDLRFDSLSVGAFIKRDFATTNASTEWRLGAWNVSEGIIPSFRSAPSVGTFSEQRLVLGGSRFHPQTLWFSATNDFTNFSPDGPNPSGVYDGTVYDDTAITFTLGSGEMNAIRWLKEQRRLVVGTAGGEWAAFSTGAVITPTDISLRPQTALGVALIDVEGWITAPTAVAPTQAGNRILFAQRGGRKLIELGYAWENDSYVDTDLTRLSRHLTESGIKRVVYAQEPHKIVYVLRNDGVLLAMTYNRAEGVVGWSRLITDGEFEDVVVIPGIDGAGQYHDSTERDEVWVIVKRVVDGQTRRYVEMFERSFENGHAQADAYYVDSLITYSGAATDTITGLDHLEGKTVKIWGDGAIMTDQVVTSGQITLEKTVTKAQIGLPYKHKFRTVKIPFGAQAGTGIGKHKRIKGLVFLLHNSHTVLYGEAGDDVHKVDFRHVADPMDSGVPLFTGEWYVDFEGDWGRDSRIYLESDDPAPFTLIAVAAELAINE